MRSVSFVVLVASLVAPCAWGQVRRDGAAAEALFADGRALMASGKYAEACGKFEASLAAESAVGTILNLANCYEKLGRTASAWAVFREAASVARAANSREREDVARARAAALEKKLCKVVIRAAPLTRVLRDGTPVDSAAFGTAIPVDPGNHLFEASAPDKKPWSRSLSISGEGVQIEVEIPELVASGPTEPAATLASSSAMPPAPASGVASSSPFGHRADEGVDRSDGTLQRTAAIGAGIVGLTGFGLMTYFGLHASSLWDEARSHCTHSQTDCENPATALSRDALSAANSATWGAVVGGIGLATAAVLWFSAPRPNRSTREQSVYWAIGPSGAVVRGAF